MLKVVRDTPFEFGSLTWQVRPPKPSLTVVIKATFDLVHDGVCAIAPEQRGVCGGLYHDDDDARSLRQDGALAVFKPHGEWWFTGTCHAPGAKPHTAVAAGFRVGDARKSLGVLGDRYW